jgi:hypothetical protein
MASRRRAARWTGFKSTRCSATRARTNAAHARARAQHVARMRRVLTLHTHTHTRTHAHKRTGDRCDDGVSLRPEARAGFVCVCVCVCVRACVEPCVRVRVCVHQVSWRGLGAGCSVPSQRRGTRYSSWVLGGTRGTHHGLLRGRELSYDMLQRLDKNKVLHVPTVPQGTPRYSTGDLMVLLAATGREDPPFPHAHTHAHAHARTHVHMHTCPHKHTCTHTHMCVGPVSVTESLSLALNLNAHACTHTRTHTHTLTRTHTHARTHTHWSQDGVLERDELAELLRRMGVRCVCVRAWVCVCVRARVRACVRACVLVFVYL